MLLKGKVAVVYGGGGIIGSAVAREFARECAIVYLAGRWLGLLEPVVAAIAEGGGTAYPAAVDVTEEEAVERHLAEVVNRAGSLDLLFNAVTHGDVQGTPLIDLEIGFMSRAVLSVVRTHLAAIRVAARRMVAQRSGVIMTSVGYGPPFPGMGTTAITWQMIEALYRQWAVELGPDGVRVAWTRIAGTTEGILDAPDYGTNYAGDTETSELLAEL